MESKYVYAMYSLLLLDLVPTLSIQEVHIE